jgi:hypothetical protein
VIEDRNSCLLFFRPLLFLSSVSAVLCLSGSSSYPSLQCPVVLHSADQRSVHLCLSRVHLWRLLFVPRACVAFDAGAAKVLRKRR